MHILDVISSEIIGRWGFAPDPTGGAYSAPPDPLDGFMGPTSKGKEEKKRGEREGRGRRQNDLCLRTPETLAPSLGRNRKKLRLRLSVLCIKND